MSFVKTQKLKMRKFNKKENRNENQTHKTIAIAGNPNVGKSTLFNALTGLRQHTGNWPGKTVGCTQGLHRYHDEDFHLVDIPGTYSLMTNSPEEEIAKDFICFKKPDAVIIAVDATCLERNLNLVLQILELTNKAVVCVNLIDEAQKKKIHIDLNELALQLGVPVVATNARSGKGLNTLMSTADAVINNKIRTFEIKTDYGKHVEDAIKNLCSYLKNHLGDKINPRWVALRLLENDLQFKENLDNFTGENINKNTKLKQLIDDELKKAELKNIGEQITRHIVERAEKIYNLCVKIENRSYDNSDRVIDKILTSKATGFPAMLLMLLGIFWITVSGANYPSEVIASGLFRVQDKLLDFLINIGSPTWFYEITVRGIYRTLAWVVSVMLPPMAIFFPLFTFLEDVGYLPRVAFNLDRIFKDCGAHGKQALTMCMGFGCNACGIMGCRIIDSPREKLIALLTNNFVPCNGRFPLLISIITMFFAGSTFNPIHSLWEAFLLTSVIIFGVVVTFLTSKLLSRTILKGLSSSFILELPPYRRPQIGNILVRSVLDRTIFVLGRAVAVAAPAGLIIWMMANLKIHDLSILMHCASFLDPFAKAIGMDGIILMAFILGFPANEIVFPIIIMSYMCTGSILELDSTMQLHALLVSHGWTNVTAICVMAFSLMHFPCGTTCWTIKKETGNLKWTALAFIIPTVLGIFTCFMISSLFNLAEVLIR